MFPLDHTKIYLAVCHYQLTLSYNHIDSRASLHLVTSSKSNINKPEARDPVGVATFFAGMWCTLDFWI